MPIEVSIKTASIKLDQFLKWAGIAATGGEAKLIIQQGMIKINGNPEIRRSLNLTVGDIIEVAGKGCFIITS